MDSGYSLYGLLSLNVRAARTTRCVKLGCVAKDCNKVCSWRLGLKGSLTQVPEILFSFCASVRVAFTDAIGDEEVLAVDLSRENPVQLVLTLNAPLIYVARFSVHL